MRPPIIWQEPGTDWAAELRGRTSAMKGAAMADDRYSRLLAAITARRESAEAAVADLHEDDDKWVHDERRFHVQTRGGLGVVSGSVYVYLRHVAVNDPAQILRDTAAHLRIVERHQPYRDTGTCSWCIVRKDYQPWEWPCPDWLDVASSYPELEE